MTTSNKFDIDSDLILTRMSPPDTKDRPLKKRLLPSSNNLVRFVASKPDQDQQGVENEDRLTNHNSEVFKHLHFFDL